MNYELEKGRAVNKLSNTIKFVLFGTFIDPFYTEEYTTRMI